MTDVVYGSKVLLVDDDEFSRFMMREINRTLEVDVVVAADGHEAIQTFEKAPHSFGLILMDLHMPRISGIEATHVIRQIPHERLHRVPIIAVTADLDFHDDEIVKSYGMDGYVSKPVTPGHLLAMIEHYCCPQAANKSNGPRKP